MENASKALIMAGEVLIGIIIISALVLMFNSLTSYQSVENQNEREAEVIQFNNKYEEYNREDVRGNDLYSLINRVVDYNERKSTEGVEGSELNYQPITLNINIENKQSLTYDGTNRVFDDGNQYEIKATTNTLQKKFKEITVLESSYPKNALYNLATGITKIYIGEDQFNTYLNNDIEKAQQVIYNFNSAYGSAEFSANTETELEGSWRYINGKRFYEIKEGTRVNIKEDVYAYYEYLQFTRAHFKCTGVKYNQGTGRIVEMSFRFTGEFS